MKRMLLLFLCMAFLLLPLFGCHHEETGDERNSDTTDVSTDGDAVLQLSKFIIVRSDSATDSEKSAATALRLALADRGISVKVSADSAVSDKSDSSYEILLGSLNRGQSKSVLASLGSRAVWTIQAVGNKIIIASPFDALLSDAVNYFTENLLAYTTDGKITLSAPVISEEYGSVAIVQNGVLQYQVISPANAPARIEESVKALMRVLSLATGGTLNATLDTDAAKTHTSATKEILLGNTCLVETADEKEFLKADEYGIALRENKLMVLGNTELTGELAIKLFTSGLQTVKNADGSQDVILLYEEPIVKSIAGYFLDFPKPTGLTEVGDLDCANGTMEFLWKNASAAAFQTYCDRLENAGYSRYAENQIGENLYVTYTGNGGMLHTYYTAANGTLRVLSAPLDETSLFPKTATAYTKVTDSDVALLSLSYQEDSNNGMSVVFTLADGSYLVYDGGETADHAQRLYQYLKDHNRRTDGKIVIAGWMLTHAHTDHYGAFLQFASSYGKQVEVNYIFVNGYSEYGVSCTFNSTLSGSIFSYGNSFANSDTKIVKVHSGQKIQLCNATVEILQTHEDFYPTIIDDANDTSTVSMVTVEGKKVLMTGDSHLAANRLLVANFGAALKCDIFQVPHHGHSGLINSLSDAADPVSVLYPTGSVGFGKYKTSAANQYLIAKVGETQVFVADGDHTVISLK